MWQAYRQWKKFTEWMRLDDMRDKIRNELMATMSLSQSMHAFTFFRRSLDQSAKQSLAKAGTPSAEAIEICEQIMALADEVLMGIAGAYEHTAQEV